MKSKVFKLIFLLCLAVSLFGANKVLAFSVGDSKNFNVDPSYDNSNRTVVQATVQKIGERAVFYVENDWWNGLANKENLKAAIAVLSDEFDRVIYPRLISVFGMEWSPGIDNEFKITILITKMKEEAGGYFNLADEYLRSESPYSNEREMIYLNGSYLDLKLARGFLAHEFQHLITFYQKEKLKNLTEETWLNEARSEYAATLLGYDNVYSGSNLEKRINEFLRTPSDSLTEWDGETYDYGSVDLFMQYLVSHYGENILTEMMKANTVGTASIDQALASLGFSERFSDVFTNWTVANFVNDCQFGDGQKFCYLSRLPYAVFHLSPSATNLLTLKEGAAFSSSNNAKDWTGYWYELLPSASLPAAANLNLAVSFKIKDAASKFRMPIVVFNSDGSKSLRYLNPIGQLGSDIILNFGTKVKSLILIPSSQTKFAGSFSNEPPYGFSYAAEVTSANQISSLTNIISDQNSQTGSMPDSNSSPNYPDGSLIRATDDYRVFVINGQYKRWIQSPAIFTAYPHFKWQNIIEVTPAQLNWYQDAWLIRADGDARVWEVNGDLTKHWLNMSAQQFSQSGRSWNMVFIINKTERDLYKTGAQVLK